MNILLREREREINVSVPVMAPFDQIDNRASGRRAGGLAGRSNKYRFFSSRDLGLLVLFVVAVSAHVRRADLSVLMSCLPCLVSHYCPCCDLWQERG